MELPLKKIKKDSFLNGWFIFRAGYVFAWIANAQRLQAHDQL